MKSKLSIAIDKLHLDKMEALVKTGKFRNRSHAIEYAIMQYLKDVRQEELDHISCETKSLTREEQNAKKE